MNETRLVLQDLGKNLVAEARYLLSVRKANASKTLSEGLRYWVDETKDGFVLRFGARGPAAKYAGYSDKGRGPGKMPPIAPIESWIKVKPVKLRDKRGKFKKRTPAAIRSAAFLIARKIGKEGSKGHFAMTDAINTYRPEIEAVKKAVAKDVRAMLVFPRKK